MKVNADIVEAYQRDGFGPAMAKFIQLVMYPGLLPDNYLDRCAPDPAQVRCLARRGGEAVARLLGVEPVIFPGHHGGFAVNQGSPHNDPAAFAMKLREVLGED